jgi:hypothetical protein
VAVLRWLWLDAQDEVVTEVRFETRDAIDDLVILTDGPRLLVQAKRSLDFSTRGSSEFASVLRRFVAQFADAPEVEEVYVLATSPSASSRIRVDLRKLTEAARLNELGPGPTHSPGSSRSSSRASKSSSQTSSRALPRTLAPRHGAESSRRAGQQRR